MFQAVTATGQASLALRGRSVWARRGDDPRWVLSASLAPRLGHGHDFQQVTIRILEVEPAPAPAAVEFAIGVAVWSAAIRKPLGLYPAEDRLELWLADMERIVMALARSGVKPRPAPWLWLVGEVQRSGSR